MYFLFIFVSCVFLSVSFPKPLTLLIIGDSVDRYMVEDWCKHRSRGYLHTERTKQPLLFYAKTSLHEVLKPQGMRRKSWEVRICEHVAPNGSMSVVFIANKFGVKPQPPWHSPIATMSGFEAELTGKNYSQSELFRIALMPGVEALRRAVSADGSFHGILLSSSFWDLSHPDPTGRRLNNGTNWVAEWASNVSTLMRTVRGALPGAQWYGWHTMNMFHVVQTAPAVQKSIEAGQAVQRPNRFVMKPRWNTKHARNLLVQMNAVSQSICRENNYDWIDYHTNITNKNRHHLRDDLHPKAEVLVELLDVVIRAVFASIRS